MCGCFVGWRFAYPTWDSCDLSLIYPLTATETAGFPPLPVGEGRGEGIKPHPLSEHGFAIFHIRSTKIFCQSLADIREGFTMTQ